MNRLAALALAALIATPLTATAIPVTYQIKFTVLTGSILTTTFPDPMGEPTVQIEDAVGKVYFGSFAVDDQLLLTDGIGKPGSLDFFKIQMEDNIWGYNVAGNNSFEGFRGPIPGDPFCLMTMACLNAPSPGFDVVDGVITNLRGGVFGVGDIPFVDFSVGGPNLFAAQADALFRGPGTSFRSVGLPDVESITGTMQIFRVPEPAGLPLLAIGLLILAWMRPRLSKSRRGD